jgi:hypothetical protein
MRFAGMSSWQIGISADGNLVTFALWLRDVEAIEVPPAELVPGPLDMGELPPASGEPHEPGLGDEWLTWWLSLVDRRPRPALSPPDDDVEPADDTPDPLGLARLPALRGQVARRWMEFLHWRTAHHRAEGTFVDRRPPGDMRTGDVVREVERALGRRAAPFHLRFTLLPVRDDRILQVEPEHYLVPERVFRSAGWPAWLRTVVERIA